MVFQAPKNDAARKAWLRGLKDGDEVTWVSHCQTRIIAIRRGREGEFLCTVGTQFNNRMTYIFTAATGKGKHTGYADSADGWIVPVTPEHRRTVAAQAARERIIGAMSRSGLREFSEEQLLKVAAILWPSGCAETSGRPG